MATTLTWAHTNATESEESSGLATVALVLPVGFTAYGAYAEPTLPAGSRTGSHAACTRTALAGHSTGYVQSAGSFATVATDTVTVTFLFKVQPGQTIRVHTWVVSVA